MDTTSFPLSRKSSSSLVSNLICILLFASCVLTDFNFFFNFFKGKPSQIVNATVGPDEPHAAGTAWPDGIVEERQDVELLPPEIDTAELEAFLGCELPSHPKLHRGQLKNGLRYLILPNKVPPNR